MVPDVWQNVWRSNPKVLFFWILRDLVHWFPTKSWVLPSGHLFLSRDQLLGILTMVWTCLNHKIWSTFCKFSPQPLLIDLHMRLFRASRQPCSDFAGTALKILKTKMNLPKELALKDGSLVDHVRRPQEFRKLNATSKFKFSAAPKTIMPTADEIFLVYVRSCI